MRAGTTRARKSLFGMVCLCAVALAAFAGSGAPSAGAAEECPNADFRKGVGIHLPDCRAYELVSPPDKNGHAIETKSSPDDAGGQMALTGSAVSLQSPGAFADAEWGGFGISSYVARRESGTWVTRSQRPQPVVLPGVSAYGVSEYSSDLRRAVLFTANNIALTSDPETRRSNWWRFDPVTRVVERLAGSNPTAPAAVGASLDLEHVVMSTRDTLTSDPGQPGSTRAKLYEWTGGQLRLVSRQPGTDTPFPQSSALGASGGSLAGAVSEDGRHIFFTGQTATSASTQKIYRRTDGTSTMLVSPSRRTVPDTEAAKVFRFGTPDGNRVFFTSNERLTDAAQPGDLYRYDVAADELLDLSAGATPAEVQGVLAIDRAGDHVYFAAIGQLVPGEGAAGLPNLYLWEDDGTPEGAVRFIATLDPAVGTTINDSGPPLNRFDSENWSSEPGSRAAEATEDGARLLFQSREDLVPEYESGGLSQVYLYDAEANGGTGELSCVSCIALDPADPEDVVDSHARAGRIALGVTSEGSTGAMSVDGSRIVFHTAEPLLERDTNGEFDAYLWEEGDVSLLSSGTSPYPSYAYGMGGSGTDAFFTTSERLVPVDVDSAIDVYTARVAGGLLSQNPPFVPGCVGEECRGAGTVPPASNPPVSSSFQGPGNAQPRPPRCGKGKRRVRTRSGKTRCVKKRRAGRRGGRR